MNRHPHRTAVLLALISVSSLIGMLLLQGLWNELFFVLALAPLALGGVAYYRARRKLHVR